MIVGRHTMEINDMQGHELTVEICAKFTRIFWIRYHIAMALIRAAGWVLNVGINVEMDET